MVQYIPTIHTIPASGQSRTVCKAQHVKRQKHETRVLGLLYFTYSETLHCSDHARPCSIHKPGLLKDYIGLPHKPPYINLTLIVQGLGFTVDSSTLINPKP